MEKFILLLFVGMVLLCSEGIEKEYEQMEKEQKKHGKFN